MKRRNDMSPQSRSGGGGGMHTVGYAGSQFAAGGAAVGTGVGIAVGTGVGTGVGTRVGTGVGDGVAEGVGLAVTDGVGSGVGLISTDLLADGDGDPLGSPAPGLLREATAPTMTNAATPTTTFWRPDAWPQARRSQFIVYPPRVICRECAASHRVESASMG